MRTKRMYTFEVDHELGLKKTQSKTAAVADEALAKVGLSNWQLAILYVIDIEGDATSSELGYALVMDRPVIAQNLKPLMEWAAVKLLIPDHGRRGSVTLTDEGRMLLERGLRAWRAANAAQARGSPGINEGKTSATETQEITN